MKKKTTLKILAAFLIFLITVLVGVRIWYVNQQVEVPPVDLYEMGEEVWLEDNVYWGDEEDASGYSITVNSAELMTCQEFLEKHNEKQEDFDAWMEGDVNYPEMVVNVHITVKNYNTVDSTEAGIFSAGFLLADRDCRLLLHSKLFYLANPTVDNYIKFALRAGTEMDLEIPFYFAPSDKVNPVPAARVRQGDFHMAVSLYPRQKEIRIKIE